MVAGWHSDCQLISAPEARGTRRGPGFGSRPQPFTEHYQKVGKAVCGRSSMRLPVIHAKVSTGGRQSPVFVGQFPTAQASTIPGG